jgi:hypothetical protein
MPGYFLYWPSIKSLVDALGSPGLDAQRIDVLPDNTIVVVYISGRGESNWKRTFDNSSPVTNVDAGLIVPLNYDPGLRPYVLYRVEGF